MNLIQIATDRSRIETAQRCKRQRFHEYHAPNGTSVPGLVPKRISLPLAVGGSVHAGLAELLLRGQRLWDEGTFDLGRWIIEDNAVAAALADFSSSAHDSDPKYRH